jgi:1-aminocyclopropane-1-carboxylate deaminase
MRLTYLDRTTYRAKTSNTVISGLLREFGDFYLLPEGGSNKEAVLGCAELPAELRAPFDVLFCAVGTGGTLAGVAAGVSARHRVIGVPVLKGGAFLEAEIVELQQATYGARVGSWHLECDYHFGGYAKRTPELDSFITDFAARHGLLLDWVYEAKMMYALFDQVSRGAFASSTTIVALISGSGEIPRAGSGGAGAEEFAEVGDGEGYGAAFGGEDEAFLDEAVAGGGQGLGFAVEGAGDLGGGDGAVVDADA